MLKDSDDSTGDLDLTDGEGDVIIPDEEYKMVLCVRQDLKMGKGKMCAQCGHAAVGAVKKAAIRTPKQLKRWEMYGQPKIALKVRILEIFFLNRKILKNKRIIEKNNFFEK